MTIDRSVEAFGEWLAGEYRPDGHYDEILILSGPDAGGADVSVRLCSGEKSYYETRVALARGEVQVGFGTEGRVLNEEIEQMVLDNGGDLSELLGDELCDLGADPLPMEHFFERPAFRYVVRLPLDDPDALHDMALRTSVKTVLKACRVLFQDCIDSA